MENKTSQQNFSPATYAVVATVLLTGIWLWYTGAFTRETSQFPLQEQVLPAQVVLPIEWGSLGAQLVQEGVIDGTKIDIAQFLEDEGIKNNVMTQENSGQWLNLLWAFGLANASPILEEGPMVTYGGDAGLPAEAPPAGRAGLAKAGRFASTGGWTVSKGSAMDHYSRHEFIILSLEQQKLVEEISRNIYRPCCDNPVYFPDCNHGMAMLGLLELMAVNNISKEEMYKVALQVNSYWFPGTYLTIAKYFAAKGVPWDEVSPKTALGVSFSSSTGYARVLSEVEPVQLQGQGCGI